MTDCGPRASVLLFRSSGSHEPGFQLSPAQHGHSWASTPDLDRREADTLHLRPVSAANLQCGPGQVSTLSAFCFLILMLGPHIFFSSRFAGRNLYDVKKHSNALRGNGCVSEVFSEDEREGGQCSSLLHPMQSMSGLLAGGSAPDGEKWGRIQPSAGLLTCSGLVVT